MRGEKTPLRMGVPTKSSLSQKGYKRSGRGKPVVRRNKETAGNAVLFLVVDNLAKAIHVPVVGTKLLPVTSRFPCTA